MPVVWFQIPNDFTFSKELLEKMDVIQHNIEVNDVSELPFKNFICQKWNNIKLKDLHPPPEGIDISKNNLYIYTHVVNDCFLCEDTHSENIIRFVLLYSPVTNRKRGYFFGIVDEVWNHLNNTLDITKYTKTIQLDNGLSTPETVFCLDAVGIDGKMYSELWELREMNSYLDISVKKGPISYVHICLNDKCNSMETIMGENPTDFYTKAVNTIKKNIGFYTRRHLNDLRVSLQMK